MSYFKFILFRNILIFAGLLTDFEALTGINHQFFDVFWVGIIGISQILNSFKALIGINMHQPFNFKDFEIIWSNHCRISKYFQALIGINHLFRRFCGILDWDSLLFAILLCECWSSDLISGVSKYFAAWIFLTHFEVFWGINSYQPCIWVILMYFQPLKNGIHHLFFRNQGILSYFEFTLLRNNLIVTGLLTDFEALTGINHQFFRGILSWHHW